MYIIHIGQCSVCFACSVACIVYTGMYLHFRIIEKSPQSYTQIWAYTLYRHTTSPISVCNMHTCCNSVMHVDTCCNSVMHVDTCCNSVMHVDTCCNSVMHVDTCCNSVMHVDTCCNSVMHGRISVWIWNQSYTY